MVLTILALGLALAIGSFFLLARRPRDDDAPSIEVATAGAVSVIGRYTLVDRIGLGGMAEIYAAVTTGEGSFRRPVVIKRLRPELTVDPNAVAQFCDEANLLAAFHHPNIVAVHDFGRWENQFFLAEEYVQGRDLGRLVRKRLSERGPPAAGRGGRLRGARDPQGARLRAHAWRTTAVGRWGSSTATSRRRTSWCRRAER